MTVHRTQGSEFGITFVVLPNPCPLLSRELLYTALTRHQKKLIVLHQGNLSEFLKLGSDYFSETARRLTNLFSPPKQSQLSVEQRPALFFEENLIHKTLRGEAVRSKSEVIIANALMAKGIKDYLYEQELVAPDGSTRRPDFTIEDSDSGNKFYWEHLGMMQDPGYKQSWEKKLKWYKAFGILPHEEGVGTEGTLIITEDDARGGINSEEIGKLIDKVLLGRS
jgi:predicted nuclease of restriction endonuclease-like RecB superfamily